MLTERIANMDFEADFTAIDFETANRRSDSACQLAAVKVRAGKIVDQAMWMIRPDPFFFSRMNIGIHGITPNQVEQESEFGDLWDDISRQFGDDCLIAHNAAFDIGVLLACLDRHRKPVPDLQYSCTRAIARRTWSGRRSYGLKPLSDWLGVRFQHHDALEDSIACAKVLLAAGIQNRATSLPDLERKLRLSRGTAGSWGKKGPLVQRSKRRASSSNPRSSSPRSSNPRSSSPRRETREQSASYRVSESTVDLQRLLIRADFVRPLVGQRIVFTGHLRTISREDAKLLASRGGGECVESVSPQTSFLVVGAAESPVSGHHLTIEQEAVEQLRREGHEIRIVNESEFLRLATQNS